MTEQFRYISHKRRPKEDRRFIAGRGRFVADLPLPGMLHVALVASPYPFARIVKIDTSRDAVLATAVYVRNMGEPLVAAVT
jgi:2-furoyl-CoA dehydrogenase large subunit